MEKEKILITKEGRNKINQELNYLISVERPQVIEEIQKARDQGDLRENSDFDAAKQRQASIEDRIKSLSDKLLNVEVISNSTKSFGIGTCIKYLNMKTNKETSIEIVGTFETNPFGKVKKISYKSPFAQTLFKNKKTLKAGDIIEIPLDLNSYKIKILKISSR